MGTADRQGTLILLRHGESTWNLENLFTGWTDVPLSEHGMKEAVDLGAVPDLTALAELGVQRGQLRQAPEGGVLASTGDGRCLHFFL